MNTTVTARNSRKNLLALGGWLLLSFAVASFGGLFMPGAWYQQLVKPSWTPPNWIFGPVWTLLYILMAVAAWLVWKQGGWSAQKRPLTFYVAQIVVNALWSLIFFGRQMIGLALVDIVLLWLLLLITTVLFWSRNRIASALLVPYLLWVTFAASLNFALWRLN